MWLKLLFSYRFLGAHKRIFKLIDQINPDIVHVNECGLNYLVRKIKTLGYYVVVHARIMFHPSYPQILKRTKNALQKYADHVICISGSVAHQFNSIEHVSIVYNPLQDTIPAIAPNSKDADDLNKTFDCLYLANLIEYKGIFELIKAAQLLSSYDNIHFKIAGSDVRKPSFYKSLLGKLLDYLGIEKNITRRLKKVISSSNLTNVELLGHVKNIDRLFKHIDVLLAPMHLNSPPRSIFEAGIYGIPSVLSLVDPVEDVVEHEFNGIIIPQKNAQKLADAILRLYENPGFTQTLGLNAQSRFKLLNNGEVSARNVFEIYENVLQKNRN